MTNVIFNSGFIGFLIWVLLFAVSTAALAIAIRCVWVLRKSIFATAEFEEKLIPFLFHAFALMVSLLPLRVQATNPQRVLSAQPLTSCPEPAGQWRRRACLPLRWGLAFASLGSLVFTRHPDFFTAGRAGKDFFSAV